MSRNRIIDSIEQAGLKKEITPFNVGDTVEVAIRIVEGDKTRIQVFSGDVIRRKGAGINETFTVRRIVNNEGVERILPIHSPFIQSIKVKRSGRIRRAKLYYLRDRVGKSIRLTEKRKLKKGGPEEGEAAVEQEQGELVGSA